MRVCALLLCALTLAPGAPLAAQSLRARLPELFTLQGQDAPLRLLRPADPMNPAAGVAVNDAFMPEFAPANAAVLTFLGNWVTGNIANVPLGTTSAGATFRFEGGVPVKTASSRGPIFGERGHTLGRRNVVAGANYSVIRFTSVRGAQMNDLQLNFTSQTAALCSGAADDTCRTPAAVASANDIVALDLAIDLDLAVTSFFLTYGLADRVDVGVVVPLVRADLWARSDFQVEPFGTTPGGSPRTFLAGTPDDPVLSATRTIAGSASGLGDVATRVKVNLYDDSRMGLAVLGDVRFPTGDEDNLLGSGNLSMRALGVYSAQLGNFSPNVSAGYLHWNDGPVNDAFLATAGFDQLLAPWATLAVAVISEFQIGESAYQLPEDVVITEPFRRVVRPAEIPAVRDDALSASLGAKLTVPGNVAVVVNSLVPVTRGGPRPDFMWTFGLERNF